MKLWQTNGQKGEALIESYTVGNDYIYDQILLPYDLQASEAHAKMLGKIGILTNNKVKKLVQGLSAIKKLWEQGKIIVTPEQEDSHTAIEMFLTHQCGEVGKKIHTGRSRNDQILVTMRLYTRDMEQQMIKKIARLSSVFQKKEKQFQ